MFGASNDDIRRWIPSLSHDEIALFKNYIRNHLQELIQSEKDIKASHDRMRAQQPAWTRVTEALSFDD